MSRPTDNGIPRFRHGESYVVRRPDGRCSAYAFGHPFRAAEHVMRAARVATWPELFQRGVRIVVANIYKQEQTQ